MTQHTDVEYGVDVINGSALRHVPCDSRRHQDEVVATEVRQVVGQGGVLVSEGDSDQWVFAYPSRPALPRTYIIPTAKPRVRLTV